MNQPIERLESILAVPDKKYVNEAGTAFVPDPDVQVLFERPGMPYRLCPWVAAKQRTDGACFIPRCFTLGGGGCEEAQAETVCQNS